MKRLRITAAAERAIRAHGEDAFPHECCGAMFGGEDEIVEVLPLPNVTDEGPRRRFRVSDADYRAADARSSGLGLDLCGFYHSHPNHPAVPSQYDLDHAWPNWSYVIVSVHDGTARDVRSWRLREDRSQFDEEAFERDAPREAAAEPPVTVRNEQ